MISVFGLAIEQIEYYKYLFKLSWPALFGLFIVLLFIALRFFHAVKSYRDHKHRFKVKIVLRLLLSLILITIYIKMFMNAYEDWSQKPAVCRGIVQSIEENDYSQGFSLLTLRYGEETITVKIESKVVTDLAKEDMIEIYYLPVKKEVFRCTLLTRQAENVI